MLGAEFYQFWNFSDRKGGEGGQRVALYAPLRPVGNIDLIEAKPHLTTQTRQHASRIKSLIEPILL